jgi:hypothetical protein
MLEGQSGDLNRPNRSYKSPSKALSIPHRPLPCPVPQQEEEEIYPSGRRTPASPRVPDAITILKF